MKRIICFIVLVLAFAYVRAGEVQNVQITYLYESDNPNETPEQARQTAIQRAQFKAIEEKFGLDVSSVSQVIQRNKKQGANNSSSSDLFALRETAVRGEWLATTKEEIRSMNYENGFWRVQVYLEGRARSKTKAKVEIKYTLINNTHDRVNRDQYYDGDDLFLRFSAPCSGSLCVYLVDEGQNAYCLLPYQSTTTGCQRVDANTDYLFFSMDADPQADEYELTTQHDIEQNAIYIIYSPNQLTKASDRRAGKNWRNQDMPRELSYEDFAKWLSKNQIKDEDMVVKTEVITIRK